jgi:asparagine synthetase B (glutamine-hydrolysing)
MCGIAGIWRKAGIVKTSEIVRMSEVIAHRGPDDLGYVMIDTRGRLPMIHFIERFDTAQEYRS